MGVSESILLDEPTREAVRQWTRWLESIRQATPAEGVSVDAIARQRRYSDEAFFAPLIEKFQTRYATRIEPGCLAGIYIERFFPAAACADRSPRRLLINLHGGGFLTGARSSGRIESIPMAALAQSEVISIDYRMAPEWRFPAATDDVVAVYRELLKDYLPKHIGIYGCSAGGVLTAQTIARLIAEELPLPGGIGMLFGAAGYWASGDSSCFPLLFGGAALEHPEQHPYFAGTDLEDPLVFPIRSETLLARFPPSLLVSAIRDQALSSVAHTHSMLVRHGVPAELHVWEGLGHAFFFDPDLSQTHEVYSLAARFFDRVSR